MADDYNGWSLTIDEDGMKATLHMEPPVERDPYTVEETVAYIKSNGAVCGLIFSAIEEMVELRKYYKDIVVAEGRLPKDGINGYYEFFFDTGVVKHPAIRSDGSVDYSSMTVVHSVRAGDKLATYTPAIPGVQGYDVRGREMRCRPGKELPAIRGTGFEMSFDGLSYIATMDGRVDYSNYNLKVCDTYELRGDLDLVTGRIDFRGDVIVHGNVRSGTLIRASKSITVEGSVEAATLIAEGDIVLKKGIQGGKRSKIICGGNLYANFIEFTEVSAKGSIEANVVMNCRLSAGKEINIAGKRGTIVGGTTYVVGTINTTNLGNPAQIKTVAAVGVSEDLEKRNHMLMVKRDVSRDRIVKAEAELELLSDSRIDGESKEIKAAKRNQLNRHIMRDKRLLEHIEAELSEIEKTMNLGREAAVNVSLNAFAGCQIKIGDKSLELDSPRQGVCFYRKSLAQDITTKSIR